MKQMHIGVWILLAFLASATGARAQSGGNGGPNPYGTRHYLGASWGRSNTTHSSFGGVGGFSGAVGTPQPNNGGMVGGGWAAWAWAA